MNVSDVMTRDVITVAPDTTTSEVARLLLDRRISAVPVVDGEGKLLGIVSEGDLMRRPEGGTDTREAWWLRLFADPEARARAYVKAHGRRAADVMTRKVLTVDEDTPLREVAALLERRRIKRAPVVRDGRVVGIVSRANLLHAVATWKPAEADRAGDRALRDKVMAALAATGANTVFLNAVVSDGVVHLWGATRSQEEKNAVRIAAENVSGVQRVEDEVSVLPTAGLGPI